MKKSIEYYFNRFKRLRRDQKNGGAPHKPILLISVIQCIKSGVIQSNRIVINPELISHFKSNWNKLVDSNHHCLFALPFYHMRSEPFWELVPNNGCEKWVQSKGSMRSLSNLNSAVNYAQIDNELFEFITNEPNLFIEFLIETYFGKHQGKDLQNDYLIDIQKQIISEPANSYSKRIEEIKSKLDSEQFNEEVFVRSDIFKREVPKTYNYACAISGLRIDSLENISMVDACHIIPFAESYNDTISNGIALSPNLHRAFDRGLISIDFQYHVIINENFIEKSGADYGIKRFDGKKINLPSNENYYPSFDSLKYHHEKFSFKI